MSTNQLVPQLAQCHGLEIGLEAKLRNYGIKRRRLALGWTQKQLGEKVGYSSHAIGAFESFRMRPIDDCREKLAAALGCTAQDIWPDWLDVLRDTSFTSVAIMEPGQVEQLTERIARRLVASPSYRTSRAVGLSPSGIRRASRGSRTTRCPQGARQESA